mmetsp:Transcript_27655/g.63387  ORF Transcript_27655/g.63387 Transcript_27655/m.63387 type:complete len:255 (+) Transcript_27655:362-1126(+)
MGRTERLRPVGEQMLKHRRRAEGHRPLLLRQGGRDLLRPRRGGVSQPRPAQQMPQRSELSVSPSSPQDGQGGGFSRRTNFGGESLQSQFQVGQIAEDPVASVFAEGAEEGDVGDVGAHDVDEEGVGHLPREVEGEGASTDQQFLRQRFKGRQEDGAYEGRVGVGIGPLLSLPVGSGVVQGGQEGREAAAQSRGEGGEEAVRGQGAEGGESRGEGVGTGRGGGFVEGGLHGAVGSYEDGVRDATERLVQGVQNTC